MLCLAVIPNLYDAQRMLTWVQVDAQLISTNLNKHRSNNSTTYEVVASYRYTYEGRDYHGRRVGISEKSDNIGDWHQRTYQRLHGNRPLQVWVNPDNPREAIIDRQLRWNKLGFYMIFVLAFGGAGIGIAWMGWRQPAEIPDGVPLWQGNPAWRDNLIRSNARTGMRLLWVFAFFWNLISSPVIFAVPDEWAKGNQMIAVTLLFPLVGMILLFHAIKRTLAWRRFGPTPLSLDPFPGSIGGDVGGSIRIKQKLSHDTRAEVVLSCVHVYRQRRGKNNQTVRDVQWQDRQQVRIEAGAQSSLIRFRFNVPGHLPESQIQAMPHYEWTVEISCNLPGSDFDRSYTIPVARLDAPLYSAQQPAIAPYGPGNLPVPDTIMQVSRVGNSMHFHFPVLRNWGLSLIGVLVGGVFSAMAWVFAFGEIRNPPPAIFAAVFGLLGGLVLLGGLYGLGNSLTVVASSSGLQVTRRIFGIPLNKLIPLAQIRAIQTAAGMKTTQGGKSTVHYTVTALTRDGKKISIAESLPGISAAEQVATQIREACGFTETAEQDVRFMRRGDGKYGMDDLASEMMERQQSIRRVVIWVSNIIGLAVFAYFVYHIFIASN